MTKNKLAIVLVISILVNGLVLGCGRVDKATNLDEIETTTFAIVETTYTTPESSQKYSETEISPSADKITMKIESLEEISQQTTPPNNNSDITETGEQNEKTTRVIAITSTDQSKSDETETTIKTIEKTTTQSEKAETTTKHTSDVPVTSTKTDKPTPTSAQPPTPTVAPEFYNRVNSTTFVQQAFTEVNRMRAEVGQDPVTMAPKLIQDYAMLRAKEEGAEGSAFHFDHQRPNGEMALDYPFQLWVDGKADKIAISENISTVGIMEPYSQNGDGMVRSFHESPGHYNNIVSPEAGSVGIGYYYNENVWLPYIVLIFLEK
ncbi:MAG: CAP domain-containing protein [Sphingobacteriia bacterium]|nr:CAP domain-containing protein [Sphingobacteriia bacterium]